jgi:tRNA dimethylallyltransferase
MNERDGHDSRRRILTIVGPTAAGKTAVAILVARELGGEIVSADSRQIYRGMDVGTAKPTAAERSAVRHHLIDIVDPADVYDAARFAEDAEAAIGRLLDAGVEPIIVGGTGFYVSTLFEGLFEGPGRDERIRSELKARAAEEGGEGLHRELAAVDPASASRIHPNDTSRVVRALEVYRMTGAPLSEWHAGGARTPRYAASYFGLTMPREELYARIEARVDAMLEAGLPDEVRSLVASGRLAPGMPGASAVGYRELLPAVVGEGGGPEALADAVSLVKRNTRRFAKRQATWFAGVGNVVPVDVAALGVRGAADAIVDGWRRAGGHG